MPNIDRVASLINELAVRHSFSIQGHSFGDYAPHFERSELQRAPAVATILGVVFDLRMVLEDEFAVAQNRSGSSHKRGTRRGPQRAHSRDEAGTASCARAPLFPPSQPEGAWCRGESHTMPWPLGAWPRLALAEC